MNPQEIDIILADLVSIEPYKRLNAARLLKNTNQPYMYNILSLIDKKYKQYNSISGLSGNPLNFSASGSVGWVLGVSLVQTVINDSLNSSVNKCKNEFEASLEGALLYLTISSKSIHAGLIELIKTVFSQKNSQQVGIYGVYALRIVVKSTWTIEPLIDLIESEDGDIRVGAILLLIPFNDIRSYEPIKNALKDNDERVRDAAATAIKDLGLNVANREIYFEKETIQKIVMVPCKYCGTLMENTCRFCPSCGAPLT